MSGAAISAANWSCNYSIWDIQDMITEKKAVKRRVYFNNMLEKRRTEAILCTEEKERDWSYVDSIEKKEVEALRLGQMKRDEKGRENSTE